MLCKPNVCYLSWIQTKLIKLIHFMNVLVILLRSWPWWRWWWWWSIHENFKINQSAIPLDSLKTRPDNQPEVTQNQWQLNSTLYEPWKEHDYVKQRHVLYALHRKILQSNKRAWGWDRYTVSQKSLQAQREILQWSWGIL